MVCMAEMQEESHCSSPRLQFAKDHVDKPEGYWRNVLWTDEIKIELSGLNEKHYFLEKEKRLGYVRNPRSLMEGTETLCRDDIGDLLGSPNHLWLRENANEYWLVEFAYLSHSPCTRV